MILEKAFLLHELFTTGAGVFAGRKSRHMYDLEKMMDERFATEAIGNDELWEAISHHRQVFTSMRDVDYTPDIRRRIQRCYSLYYIIFSGAHHPFRGRDLWLTRYILSILAELATYGSKPAKQADR